MKANLDIIIPCYNAKDTILSTLNSIKNQQDIEGYKVYLVNDASNYDYHEEVETFSSYFQIQEIQLSNNVGPGGARKSGINQSSSQYIMFIDSDDVLYDQFSLRKLYNATLNHDLVVSNFILERDNIRVVKKKNMVWLHGKIYNRNFLVENNINFNDSRANEDNGFNRLILLLKPNLTFLDEITYIYRENPNSITRSNNRNYKISGLEGFTFNIKWAIDEALKRGANPSIAPNLATSALISMYYDYLAYIDEVNADDILKFSKSLIPYITNEQINKNIKKAAIEYKEKELTDEKKTFNKFISYDEFIDKVKKY